MAERSALKRLGSFTYPCSTAGFPFSMGLRFCATQPERPSPSGMRSEAKRRKLSPLSYSGSSSLPRTMYVAMASYGTRRFKRPLPSQRGLHPAGCAARRRDGSCRRSRIPEAAHCREQCTWQWRHTAPDVSNGRYPAREAFTQRDAQRGEETEVVAAHVFRKQLIAANNVRGNGVIRHQTFQTAATQPERPSPSGMRSEAKRRKLSPLTYSGSSSLPRTMYVAMASY